MQTIAGFNQTIGDLSLSHTHTMGEQQQRPNQKIAWAGGHLVLSLALSLPSDHWGQVVYPADRTTSPPCTEREGRVCKALSRPVCVLGARACVQKKAGHTKHRTWWVPLASTPSPLRRRQFLRGQPWRSLPTRQLSVKSSATSSVCSIYSTYQARDASYE